MDVPAATERNSEPVPAVRVAGDVGVVPAALRSMGFDLRVLGRGGSQPYPVAPALEPSAAQDVGGISERSAWTQSFASRQATSASRRTRGAVSPAAV